MCDICRRYRCPPGCPNNTEEEKIFDYCSLCREPIYDGEDYYCIDDNAFCEECVSDSRREAEC